MIFLKLTGKEIKHQFKSITFYVFLFVVLAFYASQYYDATELLRPPVSDKVYNTIEARTEEEMLEVGYKGLYGVYLSGKVNQYVPVSRSVKLTDGQKQELEIFLNNMAPDGNVLNMESTNIQISYQEMIDYMNHLDSELGGNTAFGPNHRTFFRALTYDEALIEYDKLRENKYISDAYARLLCDYLGLFAGGFVVFFSAFSLLRDKQSGNQELIYASKIKSIIYVGAKFTGLFISIMSIFLSIGIIETFAFLQKAMAYQIPINMFVFIKYIFMWISPTVMFSIALPMFISIIFENSIVPIAVQLSLALFNVFNKANVGEYGISNFMIRYNVLDRSGYYNTVAPMIAYNRFFYVGLSLVLVLLTSVIWTIRRNNVVLGGQNGNKLKECQ